MGPLVFTLDVEDWFHILDLPSTPPIARWDTMPSRVERNTMRMLELLAEYEVKSTFFFLAWVAERWPGLVHEAVRHGHEVASHGYAHELVYAIGRDAFRADIRKAKDLLEQISGTSVLGYRCPGFSVRADTPWFFDEVRAAGYLYDSSVFPASRNHGGLPQAPNGPYLVHTPHGDLKEFPISMARTLGRPMYFFGGGYLRVFPYAIVRHKVRQVLAEGRTPVFYLHPREIDAEQPRLPMSAKRRWMSYVGLSGTEPKLRRLFRQHRFVRFADLLGGVSWTISSSPRLLDHG
jgi:polysaccharide deacetylase family protein (PEP-CTERM system associated)